MAITKPVIPVAWSGGSATGTLPAASSLVSDAITVAVDEVSGELVLVATSGATESGYHVDFYLQGSADGTNYSDEGIFLGRLTMAAAATTYRSRPINIPLGLEKYKIMAVSDNPGSESVTVDVEMKALKVA